MTRDEETTILKAYREVRLAVAEKGLSGSKIDEQIYDAAARLSTRLLKKSVRADQVRLVVACDT